MEHTKSEWVVKKITTTDPIDVHLVLESKRETVHHPNAVFIVTLHNSKSQDDVDKLVEEYQKTQGHRFLGSFETLEEAMEFRTYSCVMSAKEYAGIIESMGAMFLDCNPAERIFAMHMESCEDFPIGGYYAIYMDDYKQLLAGGFPVRIATPAELSDLLSLSRQLIARDITKHRFKRMKQIKWIPILSTLDQANLVNIQEMVFDHINNWEYICAQCYKIAYYEPLGQREKIDSIKRNLPHCFSIIKTLPSNADEIQTAITNMYRAKFAEDPNYVFDAMPGFPPIELEHKSGETINIDISH